MSLRTLALVLACPLVLVSMTACDDGANPANTSATPDTAGTDETDETDETAAAEPETEPEPEPEPEPTPYAPGPYGTGYLDIIKDLSFYEPWIGHTYKLSDYYQSEETKVILIASAAGWCTACQYEAWDLVETYAKYQPLGLEIFYTLYEDNRGKPLLQDGVSWEEYDRDLTYMQLWKENLGSTIGLEIRAANYPFMADQDFVLEEYYNQGATPLTLIVRTRDMRILYRQVGYSPGSIDNIVKGVIYQQ